MFRRSHSYGLLPSRASRDGERYKFLMLLKYRTLERNAKQSFSQQSTVRANIFLNAGGYFIIWDVFPVLGGRRGAWACVCNARWGIVYSTVPCSTPVQWQWGPGDSEPGSAPLSTIFASFRRGQSRSDGRINLLIFIHLGRIMKLKIESISF